MRSARRLLGLLALEVALWCLIPAVFLALYVRYDPARQAALVPHLQVALWVLLGVALARLMFALPRVAPRVARAAAALLVSTLLALMIAYYALVLIGLHSWGRVVSWDLIVGYSGQLAGVADALGLSLPLALGTATLAWLALLAGTWIYLRGFDWAPLVRRRASPALLAALLAGGAGVWAVKLYAFAIDPPTGQAEPVSLTAFPMRSALNLQGHSVDRLAARMRDEAEDRARAAYVPAAVADPRNVILIVVDALRPDHMGIYGYARDTTPQLARLQRAGLVRLAPPMRAVCASSLCGLLGIAASRYVHQFSERPITLQEVLRRHGYRVHLVLGGDHTLFYGLKQSYGEVDSYFDGRSNGVIRYINDDRTLLDHLAGFPAWDGRPVMLQFHLMSAHLLGRRDPAVARYSPAVPYAVLPGRDRESALNYYDNGVLQADATIAALLETLGRKGYLKNTVVAITADHGELLGEHGLYQHANSVYEEVLRVPLLLLSYGYRPSRQLEPRRLASQIDLAPTLLAELGLPRPATWLGRPLQDALPPDFLYFQELADVGLYDLRDPAAVWKYWIDGRTGKEYAFNLSRDPGELDSAPAGAPPGALTEWRRRVMERSGVGVGQRYGSG